MSTKPMGVSRWVNEAVDRRASNRDDEARTPPTPPRKPKPPLGKSFHDSTLPDDLPHWRKLIG